MITKQCVTWTNNQTQFLSFTGNYYAYEAMKIEIMRSSLVNALLKYYFAFKSFYTKEER